MKRALPWVFGVCILVASTQRVVWGQSPAQALKRNVIIFVADGLRRGSVNAQDTPALLSVRTQGVDFPNSHSLFPTFTTANASAIATGHGLGDTGDFSNTIWIGYPRFLTHNFNDGYSTSVPFLEDDQTLGDLDDHYGGNYLGEQTLMAMARAQGYNTASIGKVGPTAIQDVAAIAPSGRRFPVVPATIFIDDETGSPAGIPLSPQMITEFTKDNISLEAPGRSNGYAANSLYNNGNAVPGTLRANTVQQQWFADVATHAVLPIFQQDADHPFVLLFWSRDPDGTQHNQGDSFRTLYPGINGDTSKLGVQNADRSLRQILDWLDAHPAIKANTDLFVTSDHGFATISNRELDRLGHVTQSNSATHIYLDDDGKLQIASGSLPNGFLAMDLAVGLHTSLFDPDTMTPAGSRLPFKQLRLDLDGREHPAFGNGLLGDFVEKLDGSDARAIVAANGGSDLIYVPDEKPETVRDIVRLLFTFDYVGGVFVDSKYGDISGTLPLKDIGLEGASALPRPAIAVAFKVFYRVPGDLQTAVQIADTGLQEGQGMHGGFGRDSTLNNMAAMGPDFKKGFVDAAPVSNADITPTLAAILGFAMHPKGSLQGRAIGEALAGAPDPKAPPQQNMASSPANGQRTVLLYQEFDGHRYFDTACLAVQDVKPDSACR